MIQGSSACRTKIPVQQHNAPWISWWITEAPYRVEIMSTNKQQKEILLMWKTAHCTLFIKNALLCGASRIVSFEKKKSNARRMAKKKKKQQEKNYKNEKWWTFWFLLIWRTFSTARPWQYTQDAKTRPATTTTTTPAKMSNTINKNPIEEKYILTKNFVRYCYRLALVCVLWWALLCACCLWTWRLSDGNGKCACGHGYLLHSWTNDIHWIELIVFVCTFPPFELVFVVWLMYVVCCMCLWLCIVVCMCVANLFSSTSECLRKRWYMTINRTNGKNWLCCAPPHLFTAQHSIILANRDVNEPWLMVSKILFICCIGIAWTTIWTMYMYHDILYGTTDPSGRRGSF